MQPRILEEGNTPFCFAYSFKKEYVTLEQFTIDNNAQDSFTIFRHFGRFTQNQKIRASLSNA